MRNLYKVITQTIWQVISKIITAFSTFILLGLISRQFGESGIGLFTLTLTYLSFFYLLGDFGFNAYYLEKLGEVSLAVWNRLLGLRILWSFILILLSLILSPYLPFSNAEFVNSVRFGCLTILGVGIVTSSNALFQRRFLYKFSAITSFLYSLVAVLFALLFSLLHFKSEVMLLAQTFGWVIGAVVSLILVFRIYPSIKPVFDLGFIKQGFRGVLPISITLILNLAYFRLDAFILSSYKSLSEVGIYNLAYSVFQSILVLPTFIMNGFFPVMLDNIRDNLAVFKKQLVLAGGIFLLLGFGCMVVVLFCSTFIISLLSGGGFSESGLLLRILALSFPAFFLSSLLMWTFVTLKRYRSMAVIYGIGLFFNFFLNLWYIPTYSYLAAAWVTVLSEYLILFLQIIMLYPIIRKL